MDLSVAINHRITFNLIDIEKYSLGKELEKQRLKWEIANESLLLRPTCQQQQQQLQQNSIKQLFSHPSNRVHLNRDYFFAFLLQIKNKREKKSFIFKRN